MENKETTGSRFGFLSSSLVERMIILFVYFVNAFLGQYVEFAGCFSCFLLCVCLLLMIAKRKVSFLTFNIQFLGVASLSAGYLVSIIWAVDRGYAFLGFVKFLPLLLFIVILMQMAREDRTRILLFVPVVGCVQIMFAVPAFIVSSFHAYFFTYERFHGGMGYSNSFALYSLCGIVILLLTDYPVKRWLRYVGSLMLLVGVFLSGSRSAFILLLPLLIVIAVKEKTYRLPFAIGVGLLVIAFGLYGVITGNFSTFARFLNYSISESTYIDRLVYYYDALRIILRHPYGLGYKGYMFTVPQMQTGVYSVTYVHCEFLQFILDVGLLPAGLFFAATGKSLFAKNSLLNKLLIGVICVHALIDFDLQFLNIMLLLGFAVIEPVLPQEQESTGNKKKKRTKNGSAGVFPLKRIPAVIGCIATLTMSIWLLCATGVESLDHYGTAVKIYPGLTMSRVMLLNQSKDVDASAEIAKQIVNHNKCIPAAYEILAQASLKYGNYDEAIELQDQVITLSKFESDAYKMKFNILFQAIWAADSAADRNALIMYSRALIELPNDMEKARQQISRIGERITDLSDFRLDDDQLNYIERMRQTIGLTG